MTSHSAVEKRFRRLPERRSRLALAYPDVRRACAIPAAPQWLPANSSRPISMRRISLVPAPIA